MLLNKFYYEVVNLLPLQFGLKKNNGVIEMLSKRFTVLLTIYKQYIVVQVPLAVPWIFTKAFDEARNFCLFCTLN
jgi:hypothetical protein